MLQSCLLAQDSLVQVHQDFSRDPGWEGFQNRIVAQDPPRVKQDFGWQSSAHIQGAGGEIGGSIWSSTTPAWYGMPIGRPLTFDDRFSASGKVAFPAEAKSGSAFLGFFNHARQEWRPWSSLVIRFSGIGNGVKVGIDVMSSRWAAGGMESDTVIPADGSVHKWRMDYDPDATASSDWPDAKLKGYLTPHVQTIEQVLERAKQSEPDITRDQLQKRLTTALRQGFISHLIRRGDDQWSLKKNEKELKGAITFQIDDDEPYRVFVRADQREHNASLDRFGIFNTQIYHRPFAFYVADLTVNGRKIDLSRDPNWEGCGNRIEFPETDFQREDFGFSETNWAGERAGEIGGTFYRVEPIDPLHAYYADDIGRITLDDPISFSGSICFTRGGTDAGMFFGYFNRDGQMVKIDDPKADQPVDGMLGVEIDGPSRVGYYFSLFCSPNRATLKRVDGPVFLPTGERHKFAFDYDPKANGGIGQITLKLDDKIITLKLTPEQRKAAATFDHFGLVSKRAGGKYVTIYFDDMTYTARRPKDFKPVFHEQPITKVPYPRGGRAY